MNATADKIHEFNDREELWALVEDLKMGVRLQVRHPSVLPQGIYNELEQDARFKGFAWHNAKHTRAFERTDMHLFTIYRIYKRNR